MKIEIPIININAQGVANYFISKEVKIPIHQPRIY